MKQKTTIVLGWVMAVVFLLALFVTPAQAEVLRADYVGFGGTAGETITVGQPVMVAAADGLVYRADADNSLRRPAVGLAAAGATVGQAVRVVRDGVFSGFSGFTPGAWVYLSASVGAISATAPTEYVQAVGFAVNATTIQVMPQAATSGTDLTFGVGDVSADDVTVGGDLTVTSGATALTGTVAVVGDVTLTGALSGQLATVSAHTASYTPTDADSGKMLTNEGAGGEITFVLSEMSTGALIAISAPDAQTVTVNPGSGVQILDRTNAAGDRIQSTVQGSSVELFRVNATEWVIRSAYPLNTTWADVN